MVSITILIEWLKKCINKQKYNHRIKHRFDKPPIAKCYCKDCFNHGNDNTCHKFNGWSTADYWFCWDAEPRGKDENNAK